jgi:NAD(P)-dependent dehydrogenase (short-subunit alcohol dehydrogenase family)
MMAMKGGKIQLFPNFVGSCRPKRKGSIINVASLLGLKGGRGSAAYAASKAGVIGNFSWALVDSTLTLLGLTRALASELGEKNIRVNVLVPGYIETDMTEGTWIFGNYI